MASSTRSWQEDTPRSQVEMELAVEQSLERQWTWMAAFVKAQLGLSSSPYDFKDRILQSLVRHWRGPLEPKPFDEAVRKELKQCVHNERRKVFRHNQACLSTAEIETLPDPASLQFASQLESFSQIQFILEQTPADLVPVLESLYGFHSKEIRTREELARDLGIRRSTLDKRLGRLFAKLRNNFRPVRHNDT